MAASAPTIFDVSNEQDNCLLCQIFLMCEDVAAGVSAQVQYLRGRRRHVAYLASRKWLAPDTRAVTACRLSMYGVALQAGAISVNHALKMPDMVTDPTSVLARPVMFSRGLMYSARYGTPEAQDEHGRKANANPRMVTHVDLKSTIYTVEHRASLHARKTSILSAEMSHAAAKNSNGIRKPKDLES